MKVIESFMPVPYVVPFIAWIHWQDAEPGPTAEPEPQAREPEPNTLAIDPHWQFKPFPNGTVYLAWQKDCCRDNQSFLWYADEPETGHWYGIKRLPGAGRREVDWQIFINGKYSHAYNKMTLAKEMCCRYQTAVFDALESQGS